MTATGLPQNVTFTLINLAVSAFALTSLDSVARVGRLSFQEFFLDASVTDENMKPWRKFVTNKYVATIVTLVLAFGLAKAGYDAIWPLFGSANQLLSVLSLVACAVFLKRTKRKGFMLWFPMAFMMAVTFSALGMTIYNLLSGILSGNYLLAAGMAVKNEAGKMALTVWGAGLQMVFAILLLVLGVIVAVMGVKKLCAKTEEKAQAAV